MKRYTYAGYSLNVSVFCLKVSINISITLQYNVISKESIS